MQPVIRPGSGETRCEGHSFGLHSVSMLHLELPAARVRLFAAVLLLGSARPASGQPDDILPGTQPLSWEGDLSAKMVEGIDRFLTREIERSVEARQRFWHRDFSSIEAYGKSVRANRER